MALTLSSLLPDILGRIEEQNPPIFWSLTGEVYPQMVDGMFEASMITGVVQLSSVQVTLAAGTTYFSMQNATAIGIPKGTMGALRLRAPYPIRKTTLKALDNYNPAWEQAALSNQIISWFPLGLSMFGIYPQLNVAASVQMDFLYSPVNEYRPYTGNETLPFQSEFVDFISQYGAAMCRAKETGAEAEEADSVYQEYLAGMKALTGFQQRVDSLVYSTAYGTQSRVNPRTSM